MEEKLEELERRFEDIEQRLSSPGLSGQELTKLSTERASLVGVVSLFREQRQASQQLAEAKELLLGANDTDMREMVKAEIVEIEAKLLKLQDDLKIELLPKDPNDSKNVILEVRAGTGGEEAALFAADLMRMYIRFADKQGWRTEVMSMTEASAGGVKEVVILVSGQNVYSRLKFEMGVHRVQRVPATEAQGRVHTSACTVAVLPEAEDVEVNIDPKDLDIKACRASGAGGQHVNKTDSAIRIVHIPTGVVVECQDERSQHKNKERAMKILKARLLEKAQTDQSAAISADRKSQVGSGDRSERIRTYNFPQGRVTDHRINLTLYNLAEVMEGDVGGVMDALTANHVENLLKASLN